MRDVILSICETNFIQKLVSEGHRLDGRIFKESRKLDIALGSAYGSCIVSLGDTKVLAQVSSEVVQPKQIRPNEGILYINVDIGPMAGPQFEANRQTDLCVYLNRLLEKCYKDSKCIDLESLCIVVEEKVWSLRVDIKVLNHDGNLIECASIATLTSLAHFKRPDVTRSGDTVTIHTLVEKDPIPTVLYHYPVCLTFAIFGNDILLSDPSLLEESVCTNNTEGSKNMGGGLLVVGMNQYKELCLLNHTGAALCNSNIVHRAVQYAADRSKELVDKIKSLIAHDDTARQRRTKVKFSDMITTDHKLSLNQKNPSIRLERYAPDVKMSDSEEEVAENQENDDSKYEVVPKKPRYAEMVAKNATSSWLEVTSESDTDS